MKKVTYPEGFLLGRVQFSLQKGLLQLLSKNAWVIIIREEFLLGRSTLPTGLSLTRLAQSGVTVSVKLLC